MSQKEMAEKLGMSDTQYGLKERGVYPFTSDEMFKSSEIFGETIENIFLPRSNQNGDKEGVN